MDHRDHTGRMGRRVRMDHRGRTGRKDRRGRTDRKDRRGSDMDRMGHTVRKARMVHTGHTAHTARTDRMDHTGNDRVHKARKAHTGRKGNRSKGSRHNTDNQASFSSLFCQRNLAVVRRSGPRNKEAKCGHASKARTRLSRRGALQRTSMHIILGEIAAGCDSCYSEERRAHAHSPSIISLDGPVTVTTVLQNNRTSPAAG
ncbi:hypothetical protein HF086_001502 [Spodoptera exigua]|uniref:Uncharacterized protein n=1 Tax=Spodoptera exigua TaxID=7107 RepID=A0A922SA25_SPOEX|nr:hypothetical protein HF086_001502 [Spodoptera exigua]